MLRVTKGRLYDSWVRYHVVHLTLNVRSDYFYGTVKAAHFAILTARSARAHKQ